MSKEILTRCGYRCDLCHAYKDNIEKDDQRELLSDGWHKFFGFKIEPEDIYCDGCISSNCHEIKLIDDDCKIRPCVIKRGYENCSQCADLICTKLEERIVKYEELVAKFEEKIKRAERKNFIKPYENYDRLLAMRDKFGSHSRMYNDQLEPTEEDMERFMEKEEIVGCWRKLNDYINRNYKTKKIIKFGGKNYGWEINYRIGSRPLISLNPERKAFTALVIFGKKEMEKFDQESQKISQKTKKLIEDTEQYHDGRWIWLRVFEEEQVDDIIKLLNIKRKPK